MNEASESRGHKNSDFAIVEIKMVMTFMIVNIMITIILLLMIVLLVHFFSDLPNIPSFLPTHSSPSPSLSLLCYSFLSLSLSVPSLLIHYFTVCLFFVLFYLFLLTLHSPHLLLSSYISSLLPPFIQLELFFFLYLLLLFISFLTFLHPS